MEVNGIRNLTIMHERIRAAAKEWSALVCIPDRVNQGLSEIQALLDYEREAEVILATYQVTLTQVAAYMFDDKFTLPNGKVCDCQDCKDKRRILKRHIELES
jgi:hypothetical protein